ncbi:MAG: outer membrane protein assembly factor BamB family protein, partial [Planctomycetota bacterium]
TAWKSTPFPPDVCTPVLYKGSLYVLDGDKDTMTCFEPETGRERWRGKLGGRKVLRASPMAADGKIYCIDENGEVFVLAAGDEFRIIARVSMGEGPCRSSIAIAYGKLFIRTARSLYCIGK